MRKGTSEEYGARELKRTLHRQLTQPLATLVARGQVEPGALVRVDVSDDQESLRIRAEHSQATAAPQPPTVLIVDDNHDLLLFLEQLLGQAGWTMLVAASAQQAREVFAQHLPHAVLLDYMLGDDDGVKLGLELQTQAAHTQVIIMTGGILSSEEATVCQERDIPVLRKPFLASDVLNLIRSRLMHSIIPASASAAPGELVLLTRDGGSGPSRQRRGDAETRRQTLGTMYLAASPRRPLIASSAQGPPGLWTRSQAGTRQRRVGQRGPGTTSGPR